VSGDNEIVAVIPARGGSKGIPRKNLARVGGHPLIGRAITAALGAALVDRVVVSTDDQEIAKVARQYGAEVVERPTDLSGDTASSESALMHAAQILEKQVGACPSILVLLQCTAPFTTSDDIDRTVRAVVNEQADSAFAAVPFRHFVWSGADGGMVAAVNHDGGPRVRRQDLAPQFLEAGSVYAMRYYALVAEGHRFCGRTVVHQVPESHCFEIDTLTDLHQAQAMAHLLDGATVTESLP
jgi:N-acylneuraminate cytidylyltransferase